MRTVVLFAVAIFTSMYAQASDATGYKSESKALSEIFTSTITKVYSARDGDIRYVAYAVVWRNHEVIVTPYSSLHNDLNIGEAVRCEMRQTPEPTPTSVTSPAAQGPRKS